MMKKIAAILVVLSLAVSMAGCGSKQTNTAPTENKSETTSSQAQAPSEEGKIAIMTPTVTQGEESYRSAELVAEQYPGKIVHVTYPDNFTTEQEVALSTILSVGSDMDVKALIISGAPAGFAAMIDKLKEQRPDLLVWAGSPSDDASVIAKAADVVFNIDIPIQGMQLADAANSMGAKTIVHYSFPRHMSVELLLERRNNMEKRAKELGITFVDGTTPDPTSDAGATGTQQFVLEDVLKMIEKYGKDTTFFGTNQAQVEPMIKTVLANGGIFLMPNDPSPFIGYPSALGIEIPQEHQGDVAYMNEQIKKKLEETGNSGRAGNWEYSLQLLNLQVGAAYADAYIKGKTKEQLFDKAVFEKVLLDVAGSNAKVNTYKDSATGKNLENYMTVLADYIPY